MLSALQRRRKRDSVSMAVQGKKDGRENEAETVQVSFMKLMRGRNFAPLAFFPAV